MYRSRYFNIDELQKVDEAVKISEELVNNFFKMSSGQWLRNRYDIKTAKDLDRHEHVHGPFAQVIKYEARKKEMPLGSSSYTLYKVCLQDDAILSTVQKKDLLLEPFLLYILSHELVHIIRFSKYKQRYENKNESDVTLDEERLVHLLTYEILKPFPISGLVKVFEFYKDWRIVNRLEL
ncbi:MAG: hypothetical protein A2277_17605 [Desulfobacterales bacterium RIFOXYA12_FULL_46_15]|nr:MAG: hypothetical protein A2277_17605 [Desulfobacterales bacterium RIFOXYA12_FULL_46_15]